MRRSGSRSDLSGPRLAAIKLSIGWLSGMEAPDDAARLAALLHLACSGESPTSSSASRSTDLTRSLWHLGEQPSAPCCCCRSRSVPARFRPLLPYWRILLLYTAIEIIGPWVLLGHAETRLNSSTTGLLIAMVPMVAAIILTVTGHDRLDARRVPACSSD